MRQAIFFTSDDDDLYRIATGIGQPFTMGEGRYSGLDLVDIAAGDAGFEDIRDIYRIITGINILGVYQD